MVADDTPPAAAPAAALRPALVLWLATQAALGLYAQVLVFAWTPALGEHAYLLFYEAGYLALGGLVLWFVWRDAEARRVFARPRPRVVELCLLVGIVTALVLTQWERAMPPAWTSASPIGMEHAAAWPWWASLLASAVAPALFEEWMYRGLLLTRFQRVLPVGLAVAVQAMLFAGMHRDDAMLLPHFVFGVVAGVLRIAAGALWPAMLMHLLWNGHLVLLAYGML
jgi:membrane protease YdiL (CAAX protease family)